MKELLPVGEYVYEKDEYSFDEAWKQLKRSYEENEFVVCFGLSESEDGAYINVDYHNIRGKIYRGYLTQNRKLHSDYFIGKSFCVDIFKLDERTKSFVATHIPVEEEGKRQLSSFRVGDRLSGVISYIGNDSSYAFVDVKEGLTFFLTAKNLLWRPVGCIRIESIYSLGDTVNATINFLENPKKPMYSTLGTLTCLNFEDNWEREIAELKIGKDIVGIAKQEILSYQTYYLPISQHVYIEFESKEILSVDEEVRVTITQIDADNHIIKALLLGNNQKEEEKSKEEKQEKKQQLEQIGGTKMEKTGSLFDLEIKATVSPFEVREDEMTDFESIPNKGTSFQIIQQRIKLKQISELHFNILKAINLFVFSTSKQIMAWLYCNKQLPHEMNQDKINHRLDTMTKLGLVDRIRFKSGEGEGIFRVYFLNKNGEKLLTGYLRTRHTSYHDALIVTPVSEIKRYLATNQILLAYQETFSFLRSFTVKKLLKADEEIPVRPSAVMDFSNSVLLVETRRRFSGWKEELLDKMKRYLLLFENYQKGILPINSEKLLRKRLYLLIVCEDMEQALEIRSLFWGYMDMLYPYIFFTYDLLIFKKSVNFSFFRFETANQDPTYYNVTDLLGYDLYHKEMQMETMQVRDEKVNEVETEDSEQIAEFLKCLKRDYFLGLDYLQNHRSSLLKKMVVDKMQDLFVQKEDGNYEAVYSEEKQYYIYLLYLLNNKMIKSLEATFSEEEMPNKSWMVQKIAEKNKKKEIVVPEASLPVHLEQAVKRVVEWLEVWCKENIDTFEIDKKPTRQTAGTQYGYDVGMNFTYQGVRYRLGFECKNYQRLLEEMKEGKDARLLIAGYAYNLLEFFMEADQYVHNIWILVSPFGDLQNNFFEKLFEKWNQVINFMKLRVFSASQTRITCEEFLSLDDEAYCSIYQHEPSEITADEKRQMTERVFYAIVDQEEWEETSENMMCTYPQEMENFDENEQMELKTLEGESILEQIFIRLSHRQNIFLVGEYGTGKTFMTYRLVYRALTQQKAYPYLPLWFKLSDRIRNLKHNNIEKEANNFVEEKLGMYDDFAKRYKSYLKAGKCQGLIILDGLDEVISGLGERELKILFLEQVCKKMLLEFCKKYTKVPLFVITSRKIDFKSCVEERDNVSFFNKFCSIFIAECCEEDAALKLKEIEKRMGKKEGITQNSRLMNIARRPLYFGFIREFISEYFICNEFVDEIDVLQKVIEKSVQWYINDGTTMTKDGIISLLHEWARVISIRMTEGKSSEIIVYKWNVPSEAKNNVICLRKVGESEFALRFYHNAIREYLVAEELYQDITNCINNNTSKETTLRERLQQLALTPEMMEFFTQLTEKNSRMKPAVIEQIKRMLQTVVKPSEQRAGTNLFSLLCHLKNELTDISLCGVWARNLYLWNCNLKRINLHNAHMKNLRLFNVNMETVDLRGADLTELVMGKDYKILDVQHIKRREEFCIYVLYENMQLVEYKFRKPDCLNEYEITYHVVKENRKYIGFCPLENDILFYSDKEIFFESDLAKSFPTVKDVQLKQITNTMILAEQEQYTKLILHSFTYKESHMIQVMPNEKKSLQVVNQKGYLYVSEDHLNLQQGETCHLITYLHTGIECFTAICTNGNSQINVYLKYSDSIQAIIYSFGENKNEHKQFKLPQSVVFTRMGVVKENLLYGVSERIVYLIDFSALEVQMYKLRIEVNCQNLILENEDGTEKVQGEAEYLMLKKANNSISL